MVRGEVDAIFLAMAGLHRLNIGHEFAVPLSPHLILPAVGQGAIGIACRSGTELSAQLRQFDDCKTSVCVNCERTVLAIIEGTCTTPIGVHAEPIEGERLSLRTRLGAPDGSYEISAHADGEWDRADKLGKTCGRQLLADPRSSALIGTHADT